MLAHLSDVGLFNAQALHLLHDEVSAVSQDNTSRFSQIEETLRDQRTLAQAGFGAFQAKFQQDSVDARAAATTQIQGIAELKEGQQQYGKVAAVGYEKIGDLQTDIQCMGAMIDNKNHQSDAFMTEIRGGISEATNSAFAQIEEIGRLKAEVMQKLHSISDRLETVPSMANDQVSTLQSLVEMMRDIKLGIRTGAQNQPNTTFDEIDPTGDHRNNDSEPTHDAEIEDNDSEPTHDAEIEGMVAQIGHFAGTMPTYRYSKDAQTIIEDIGRLLGLMMQRLSATNPSRDDLPRKRKLLSDYEYSELETEVQSMEDIAKTKRILTASPQVRISDQGLHTFVHVPNCLISC